MKVYEIMTTGSLKYCMPETKLHNAAEIMKSAKCGALPVIDSQKKVVGMITDRDIALSLPELREKNISQMSVRDVMTTKVHSVKATDNVKSVLKKMRLFQVGRLPVIDENDRLTGIVSIHYLLSQMDNGKLQLGTLNGSEENLVKAVHSVANRYSQNAVVL